MNYAFLFEVEISNYAFEYLAISFFTVILESKNKMHIKVYAELLLLGKETSSLYNIYKIIFNNCNEYFCWNRNVE